MSDRMLSGTSTVVSMSELESFDWHVADDGVITLWPDQYKSRVFLVLSGPAADRLHAALGQALCDRSMRGQGVDEETVGDLLPFNPETGETLRGA